MDPGAFPEPGITRVHLRPSKTRQFLAVLHKNFLLQVRSRKSFLGVGGWGAFVLQLLVPAAFFALMCIPKYYIKPIEHKEVLEPRVWDLDSRWWSGPDPYSGEIKGHMPDSHVTCMDDVMASHVVSVAWGTMWGAAWGLLHVQHGALCMGCCAWALRFS